MKAGFAILLWAGAALGQAALPPAAATVTVKSSPASDALMVAAKDLQSSQRTLEVASQQAKATMDASQKALNDQLIAITTDLNKRVRADKKYSADFEKIDSLQKQLQTTAQQAQQKFVTDYGPIQQKVATDNAVINGLVPVVKAENGLDEKTIFDPVSQSWHAK